MNQIHFLRAYWSDIILVESDGLFAMIDTGYTRDAERIMQYLDAVGVKRLEWILITHFHKDHYGSLVPLLERYPVGRVYMKKFSGINTTDSAGKPATEASNRLEMENCESMCRQAEAAGAELIAIDDRITHVTVGAFVFQLFGTADAIRDMYEAGDSPYRGQVRFNENMNSMALFCEAEGVTIYLGADLANNSLDYAKYDRLNDRIARTIGRPIDIYKVPHHGCGNIFSEELLEIFKPRYSVVTNWWMTAERSFGANLEMLRSASPEGTILFTDECGYCFTISKGELSCHKITALPEITLEEIPVEEADAFFDKHIRYLIDDDIIDDEEDIGYFTSEEYRGVIRDHMRRDQDRHHLVYFVREGQRIGAASYCTYQSEDGRCFILDFWVFPEFRGMGTGHYCYYALEAAARADGAKYFEINVGKPLPLQFWRAFGYVEKGVDEWGMPLYEVRPEEEKS